MGLEQNVALIILLTSIVVAVGLVIFTFVILRRYSMANFHFLPSEKVLLIVREHKFLLFMRVLLWALVAAIPLGIEQVIFPVADFLGINSLSEIWTVIKISYWILALSSLFVIFALYLLNVHIVTDARLVDSDQIAITHHRVTEAHLDKVQDVSAKVKGVFGHVINYGNVEIQSAGDIPKMTFENVGNPREIKRLILDAHYKFINGNNL